MSNVTQHPDEATPVASPPVALDSNEHQVPADKHQDDGEQVRSRLQREQEAEEATKKQLQEQRAERERALNCINEALLASTADEIATRNEIAFEALGGLGVARVAETVCREQLERDVVNRAYDMEIGPLSESVSRSLEQALLLTRLSKEAELLEDEKNNLDIVHEAATRLLHFVDSTWKVIREGKMQLDADSEKLAQSKRRLADMKQRLVQFPIEEHSEIAERLNILEQTISQQDDEEQKKHTTSEQQAEGTQFQAEAQEATGEKHVDPNSSAHAAPPTDATTTSTSAAVSRPALLEAWHAVSSETLRAVDGSSLYELARYERTSARCDEVAQRHAQVCQYIDTLFQNHEARLVTITDEKINTQQELLSSFEHEMASLENPRKKLKQVEDEQQFHIRRGTFIKEKQNRATHDDLLSQRVKGKHTSLCGDLIKAQAEIKIAADEVRELKRSLEDTKRSMTSDVALLESKKNDLSKDAEELAGTRGILERESADLRSLKQDVNRILQFVRLKNKNS